MSFKVVSGGKVWVPEVLPVYTQSQIAAANRVITFIVTGTLISVVLVSAFVYFSLVTSLK